MLLLTPILNQIVATETIHNTADVVAPAERWSLHCPSGKTRMKILQAYNFILQTENKQITNNDSMARQKITEIYPGNNELNECHTSDLQNKIWLFANCFIVKINARTNVT